MAKVRDSWTSPLLMFLPRLQKTPDRIPTCKICNKEFKSRTILYRHRQTHLEKCIQCGVCEKQFSTISQIQSHQAKMNHEKIIKCNHCLVTFTVTSELKVSIVAAAWDLDTSCDNEMNCVFSFPSIAGAFRTNQCKTEKVDRVQWNARSNHGFVIQQIYTKPPKRKGK